MADYESEVLQRLQKAEFELSKIFFAFCAQQGIPAVALYGTTLGALRHQGFIPWDDDMDVGMMRADYDRFMALADQLPDTVELLNTERTPGYTLVFAKLCWKGTTFEECGHPERTYHQGIYIDIYPLDYAPADADKRRALTRKTFLYGRLCALAEYDRPALPEGMTGAKAAAARLACALGHGAMKLFGQGRKKIYARYVRTVSACANEGLIFDAADMRPLDTVVPQNVIFPAKLLPFMDGELPMPADADAYCTAYYHDYMTLPAPKDRHNHPPAVLDFGN